MRILMYRWKAYNYRDIEQTFLLLGHTVDNIEQELADRGFLVARELHTWKSRAKYIREKNFYADINVSVESV